MHFHSSNAVPTTDDQQQSIEKLKNELMSTVKSVISDTQKGV
jgi:hypothetical protein